MNNDELVTRLAGLLASDSLGSRSRWALETALNAAETESVRGFLVIEVPPRIDKDRVDVHFTAGNCQLVNRWDWEGR